VSRRPEISVVVPTHNRRESLLRLLASLRDGTFPPDRFEVIVVADGCNDDTVAAASGVAWPFPLRTIEQTPPRGAASARNLGARASASPILLFIDDDIEPLPTLLAVHVGAHARAERQEPLVVVGAPIPVRSDGVGLHHLAIWGWWEQRFEQMREPGHRFTYNEILTGALSMPTSVFRAIDGFAESLPHSCRDDSELGLRLIRHGVRIEFSREAGGFHHEIRDRRRLAERKRAEGGADAMLARMHPEVWPALMLSWPDEPLWSRLGFFRRVGFSAPALGDLLASAMARALDVLEWIRARGYWRQLHAGTAYYWYWRGAASALGSMSALRGLADAAHDASLRRTVRHSEIDLRDGIERAAATLDLERPDAARLMYGACEIGRIPAVPGAEPLRGVHLRPILERTFALPLIAALSLEDLGVIATSADDPRPRIAPDVLAPVTHGP
jgi:glycosyltransferase involved in cell wall biosynthesis